MISELEILKKRLEREKKARIEAEKILENKSRELYENNLKLNELNDNLKSEIEKRTSEIIDKEKKYREFIENSSDIIYTTDEDGYFTYINEAGIKISGYEKNELIGQKFLFLIPQEHHTTVEDFYSLQLSQEKKSSYFEFPIQNKSGSTLWIGQTADFIKSGSGSFEIRAYGRDITEKKQLEEYINRSEEKYRNIIENLELGLLEVNTEDEIINVYPKFTQLTGYSKEELIGKKAKEVLLPDEYYDEMSHNEKEREKGVASVYETQIKCKNNELKWVIISGAPYYDKSNKIVGSLGIHLDITDRKKMETDLLLAKEQAEKSIQTQELFMANMSHEIRTPMNAIIGMNDLLINSDLSNRQLNYAKTIKSSAESLLVIINDVLDFSKIEAGKLELDPTPTSIKEVLEKCINIVSYKAEEKGLPVSLKFDNEIHHLHLVDGIRLNQIVLNLLSNAIKFTDKVSITILCELISSFENVQNIKFSVKDTGVGLSQESIKKVFESFVQAEGSTTRNYGGTGLGLSISKSLVAQMNSELKVESALNKGSIFHFTLSLKKTKLTERLLLKEEIEDVNLDGLTVLLVDDNKVNRFMALTFLEQKGCIISEAENGKEAIELISTNQFDIILMDVRMPVMDGFQATKIIRDELNLFTPIVALTANALKGDSDKCLAAGMNDYLSKPFTKEQLFHKMNYVVKNNFSRRKNNKTTSLLDITLLENATMGNAAFQSEMISLLIEELPKDIAKMESAISEEDIQVLALAAHKIKPSINYVAIKPLRDKVREIESLSSWDDHSKSIGNQIVSELKSLIKELRKVK